MYARSKEAWEAALQRGRAGCHRGDGQGQLRQGLKVMLRTLTLFLGSMIEGSNSGEWLEGTYGDTEDQLGRCITRTHPGSLAKGAEKMEKGGQVQKSI